jgi:hypothetical protein
VFKETSMASKSRLKDIVGKINAETDSERKKNTLDHYSANYVCCYALAGNLRILGAIASSNQHPPLELTTSMCNLDTGEKACALLARWSSTSNGYMTLPHCPFCGRELAFEYGETPTPSKNRDPKFVLMVFEARKATAGV